MEQEIEHQNRGKEQLERQYLMLQDEHNAMYETHSKKNKSLQAFNQQIMVASKEVQDKNHYLLEKVQEQENDIQHQQ